MTPVRHGIGDRMRFSPPTSRQEVEWEERMAAQEGLCAAEEMTGKSQVGQFGELLRSDKPVELEDWERPY